MRLNRWLHSYITAFFTLSIHCTFFLSAQSQPLDAKNQRTDDPSAMAQLFDSCECQKEDLSAPSCGEKILCDLPPGGIQLDKVYCGITSFDDDDRFFEPHRFLITVPPNQHLVWAVRAQERGWAAAIYSASEPCKPSLRAWQPLEPCSLVILDVCSGEEKPEQFMLEIALQPGAGDIPCNSYRFVASLLPECCYEGQVDYDPNADDLFCGFLYRDDITFQGRLGEWWVNPIRSTIDEADHLDSMAPLSQVGTNPEHQLPPLVLQQALTAIALQQRGAPPRQKGLSIDSDTALARIYDTIRRREHVLVGERHREATHKAFFVRAIEQDFGEGFNCNVGIEACAASQAVVDQYYPRLVNADGTVNKVVVREFEQRMDRVIRGQSGPLDLQYQTRLTPIIIAARKKNRPVVCLDMDLNPLPTEKQREAHMAQRIQSLFDTTRLPTMALFGRDHVCAYWEYDPLYRVNNKKSYVGEKLPYLLLPARSLSLLLGTFGNTGDKPHSVISRVNYVVSDLP